MRRLILSAVVLSAFAVTVLAAGPANAGTANPAHIYLPTDGSTCGTSTTTPSTAQKFYTGANSTGSALINSGPPGIAAGTGDTITFTNECASTVYLNTGGLSGGSYISVAAGATTVLTISGNGNFAALPTNAAGPSLAYTGISGQSQGGGTTPTNSSSTSTPVTETLSLSVAASGATCTGGNPTGYAGSWLTLPGADQCSQSGPSAKAGAKLLGWATSANFPVARAQAQIDKKWGVIDEVIDGQRMIFIPGGMATFVSGSNNLFPIWSA